MHTLFVSFNSLELFQLCLRASLIMTMILLYNVPILNKQFQWLILESQNPTRSASAAYNLDWLDNEFKSIRRQCRAVQSYVFDIIQIGLGKYFVCVLRLDGPTRVHTRTVYPYAVYSSPGIDDPLCRIFGQPGKSIKNHN